MILGMSIATFTAMHVVISLIGIAAGLIVVVGMLSARRLPGWTALFLITTVLTSAHLQAGAVVDSAEGIFYDSARAAR